LTSPIWPISDADEPLLAPSFADFSISAFSASPSDPADVPDVDAIMRGEYTGWVPIITPGMRPDGTIDSTSFDSPEELLEAIEQKLDADEQKEEDYFSAVLSSSKDEIIDNVSVPVEPLENDDFKFEVQDPDVVVSPAQALEEARARIEQMRASLQLNLNRVAQSFEHPIFNAEPHPDDADVADDAEVIDEEILDEPESPAATVVVQDQNGASHSLELAIMRDEIQDLRERLTSSQRLVEELMHKLANLTEIALKR
jgi:hypothetical protein